MTQKQLEQFDKVRLEYLEDLRMLRTYYLKRFLKILKAARR